MEKITYKEAMTRGRIQKAILIAESVMKSIEDPENLAPIGLRLEQAYIQIQKIFTILKSL